MLKPVLAEFVASIEKAYLHAVLTSTVIIAVSPVVVVGRAEYCEVGVERSEPVIRLLLRSSRPARHHHLRDLDSQDCDNGH